MKITLKSEKILEKYPSLMAYCKEKGLSRDAVVSITIKKNPYFKPNTKAYKAFTILKADGYIDVEGFDDDKIV